ncbi:endo-1,4-beta-xylanase [Micromonospora pattaloongensis]|uniref:Beta-xylanase n=1 Tax=Micromonospora pattaloongensis TaxID=405436 RepID=A0A1H3PDL4_9ACTN|nr:endo-1,4-beta-xylanase [Micromonospora pattaloongensis]SDY99170.1 endo-1,4-beta-xylanase [Micromonospora pattaloongensis]
MKLTRAVATAATATAVLISLTAAAPLAATAGPAAGSEPATGPTLRALAARADVRIGTAVNMDALASDTPYREHVAREFNTVTAENVMKWEATEPQRGAHDWAAADQLVDFARANRQLVRGHTLVWHNQNPSWVTEGDFSSAELRQILKKHIQDEVRHFKGRIWHWDVANEIFTDDGQWRNTIWLEKLGPGYVADALRWAHQADPKARLYLNDYNVEGINAKSTAYYNLIKQLRSEGVPVHGFGIQGHLGVQYGFPGQVLENLQRFDALGVETAFTEVDVRMPMPADATKLQAQAFAYSALLQACLLARKCVSYTVWGFTDKYSWVPDWFEGEGAANLLDENYGPKPAHAAVSSTLTLAGSRGRR